MILFINVRKSYIHTYIRSYTVLYKNVCIYTENIHIYIYIYKGEKMVSTVGYVHKPKKNVKRSCYKRTQGGTHSGTILGNLQVHLPLTLGTQG